MQNPWLEGIDDDQHVRCDSCGVFYGVFSRDPAEIAKELKRPAAPFYSCHEFASKKTKNDYGMNKRRRSDIRQYTPLL